MIPGDPEAVIAVAAPLSVRENERSFHVACGRASPGDPAHSDLRLPAGHPND